MRPALGISSRLSLRERLENRRESRRPWQILIDCKSALLCAPCAPPALAICWTIRNFPLFSLANAWIGSDTQHPPGRDKASGSLDNAPGSVRIQGGCAFSEQIAGARRRRIRRRGLSLATRPNDSRAV